MSARTFLDACALVGALLLVLAFGACEGPRGAPGRPGMDGAPGAAAPPCTCLPGDEGPPGPPGPPGAFSGALRVARGASDVPPGEVGTAVAACEGTEVLLGGGCDLGVAGVLYPVAWRPNEGATAYECVAASNGPDLGVIRAYAFCVRGE